MLLNLLVAANDFSKADLGELRHTCIEEVMELNESIKLDDAIQWQK